MDKSFFDTLPSVAQKVYSIAYSDAVIEFLKILRQEGATATTNRELDMLERIKSMTEVNFRELVANSKR